MKPNKYVFPYLPPAMLDMLKTMKKNNDESSLGPYTKRLTNLTIEYILRENTKRDDENNEANNANN